MARQELTERAHFGPDGGSTGRVKSFRRSGPGQRANDELVLGFQVGDGGGGGGGAEPEGLLLVFAAWMGWLAGSILMRAN